MDGGSGKSSVYPWAHVAEGGADCDGRDMRHRIPSRSDMGLLFDHELDKGPNLEHTVVRIVYVASTMKQVSNAASYSSDGIGYTTVQDKETK